MRQDYPDAYRPLCERLGLDQGIPYTPNWSAGADFLEHLVEAVLAGRPAQIIECSSGLSTLILARACERAGSGMVWSLEHGAEYVAATRAALAAYGLQDWATVMHAPLRSTPLGEGTWQWYDLSRLPPMRAGLLAIDGPPGFLQPLSRYPALPMLASRLAPGCQILLDDAGREDERQAVARWRARYPGLEAQALEAERGCVRLLWPGEG